MSGPFGGEETAADEQRIKEVEEKLKSDIEALGGKEVVIKDDDEGAPTTVEERLSRQEKKQRRHDAYFKKNKQERDEWEERAKSAEQSNQELKDRLTRLEEQARLNQGPPKDTLQDQIASKYDEAQRLAASLQVEGLSQEEQSATLNRLREVDQERTRLVTRLEIQAQRANEPPPQMVALQAQFADVMANPHAIYKAGAFYNDQLAEGAKPSPDLGRRALEHARKWLNRENVAPTEREKRKFEGSRRGGGSEDVNNADTYVLTPAEQKMAAAARPNMSEDERNQWFAKNVKRPLAKK